MKKLFYIFVFIASSLFSNAQVHELGLMAGTTYYIGDINPAGHFRQIKPAGGLMYRYNMNYRMALRAHLLAGGLKADDKIIKHYEERNLSFRSGLAELGAQFELSYFKFKIGSYKDAFTPYLFVGASAFYYNPKALYDGEWEKLRPLRTEGQGTDEYPDRKPYKPISFAVPFGMGIKFSISSSFVLGLEWGMRKTITDYIDDVSTTYVDPNLLIRENSQLSATLADRSDNGVNKTNYQRGNALNKDWYSFAGITLSFRFKGGGSECYAFGNKGAFKKKFRPRHIAR